MSTNQRDRHDNRDQEDRIDALKQQAEQATRGEMIAWESDALSPDQREQFWRRVVEYEVAATTNDFQQLTDAGLALPEPDAMHDQELTLRRVVRRRPASVIWLIRPVPSCGRRGGR